MTRHTDPQPLHSFPTRRSSDLVLPQRQAALVAKQEAQLDFLTKSRNRIAVGLGWNQLEYQAMGSNWKDRASRLEDQDRKSTRLNSSHTVISYAVFCLKKKKNDI